MKDDYKALNELGSEEFAELFNFDLWEKWMKRESINEKEAKEGIKKDIELLSKVYDRPFNKESPLVLMYQAFKGGLTLGMELYEDILSVSKKKAEKP